MNVDLIRELYKAGCTVNQIALRMSVPVHKVEAVVKALKAKPPAPQPEPVAAEEGQAKSAVEEMIAKAAKPTTD